MAEQRTRRLSWGGMTLREYARDPRMHVAGRASPLGGGTRIPLGHLGIVRILASASRTRRDTRSTNREWRSPLGSEAEPHSLEATDPDEPWTIHLRPRSGSSLKTPSSKSVNSEERPKPQDERRYKSS
jgi:hypothetical protein